MAFNGKFGPDVPLIQAGYGLRTPFGLFLPPGGRVAGFVRSTGPQDQDDASIANNLHPTLASALLRCRSGLGDAVICLPGHSESVVDATMLDNLANGTRIIGVGVGSLRPTFRWTATGSQWGLDNNDVVIQGCRLQLDGANGVVKAILATGADCLFVDNLIEMAEGAALKATIGIEVGAGAHRFSFLANRVIGTVAHNVTDGIKIVAAVNDLNIAGNKMVFSATAGNGLIHVTAAALGLLMSENTLYNTHTASTSCITIDSVAANGILERNNLATISTGTATSGTEGIALGAAALVRCFNNFAANDPKTSGLLLPTVDT